MVLSSPKIMQALLGQITAGLDVAGIYDGPEMDEVATQWGKFPAGSPSAQHLALWRQQRPGGQASFDADLGGADPAGVQRGEHQVRGQHGQRQYRQPPRRRPVRPGTAGGPYLAHEDHGRR